MAFTRSFLDGLGIEKEKISAIIEAHVEVTDSLKKERDSYKEKAELADDLQSKLDKATDWKGKHDALKDQFDRYKSERESADTKAAKSGAYRDALKQAGIAEKYIDRIMKIADIDAVNVDDASKLAESVKTEWAEFVPAAKTVGANVPTPKATSNGTMTRSEIAAISDRDARREAIRNNPQAFTTTQNNEV